MTKTAVILCNLGGPDNLSAVEPFLFNLFNDPAIIGAPKWVRYCIAKLISKRRAPIAQKIYEVMGGKSPIAENTQAQLDALQKSLAAYGEYKCFMVMRYWHPRAQDVVQQVKSYAPDKIIFLPLYPQYSTTTTASSYKEWNEEAEKAGITIQAQLVCCYPTEKNFIKSIAELTQSRLKNFSDNDPVRILFSAHGLPKKTIAAGDPYQWQVEQTAQAIVKEMAIENLDSVVCYQSRVGPLEWIGPATPDEITRAGRDKKNIVLVPVAFVSEHSETLVELDVEYAELAAHAGISKYERVPTVSVHDAYIQSLTELCLSVKSAKLCSQDGEKICPSGFGKCPHILQTAHS